MRILVSNDDGVLAAGITALAEALRPLGEVLVIAPETEQSGCSRALTLQRPLRVRQVRDGVYAVDGTPTDCILLAARGAGGIVDFRPDCVVSGINHGANLGDDVTYSGTVAAAIEGCLIGVPSIAVSLAGAVPSRFDAAARVAHDIASEVLRRGIPRGTLLNVNVPDRPYEDLAGIRITRLAKLAYPTRVGEHRDPWGRAYYWLGGERPNWEDAEGSDYAAVTAGFVSVTPMRLELTHPGLMEELRGWGLSLRGEGDGSGSER